MSAEKFCVDDTDDVDVNVKTIATFPFGEDNEITIVECPHCHGFFGVDSTYLDQVDTYVHCPMCCMEVTIEDE